MAEKPILFNTQMVRAILRKQKTTTRRIAKPQIAPCFRASETFTPVECDDGSWTLEIDQYPGTIYEGVYYPPCFPGDTLYVRETWACPEPHSRFLYRANYSETEKFYRDGKEVTIKWHPSLHMPKSAARIFLKVTNVTLERLQNITATDITAEGVSLPKAIPDDLESTVKYENELRKEFKALWDSTVNKKDIDRDGFDADPLVWVIEFEKIK